VNWMRKSECPPSCKHTCTHTHTHREREFTPSLTIMQAQVLMYDVFEHNINNILTVKHFLKCFFFKYLFLKVQINIEQPLYFRIWVPHNLPLSYLYDICVKKF